MTIRFNDDYIRYAGWVASEWRKAKVITPEQAVSMYKKAIKAVNRHQGLNNKYDGKGNLRADKKPGIDNNQESMS